VPTWVKLRVAYLGSYRRRDRIVHKATVTSCFVVSDTGVSNTSHNVKPGIRQYGRVERTYGCSNTIHSVPRTLTLYRVVVAIARRRS
jgi:hypothetical protein